MGIKWNDKTLNISWRIKKPILSNKDKKLPTILVKN
jgi:dTDP-4-dehydrorhamnose 3,5-epimerase-like enzyme